MSTDIIVHCNMVNVDCSKFSVLVSRDTFSIATCNHINAWIFMLRYLSLYKYFFLLNFKCYTRLCRLTILPGFYRNT